MKSALLMLRLCALALALVGIVAVVIRRKVDGRRDRMVISVITLALLLHVAILGGRAYVISFVPLASISDVLVLLSLLVLGIYLASGKLRAHPSVGIGVCGASAAMLALSALVAPAGHIPPELRSLMLPIHVLGATASYACFTLNCVLYVYLAVRSLASGASARADLTSLTMLARRFGLAGYVLFAVFVMGMGMVWAKIAWGRFWGWDPKEILSLVTFCAYSLYLYFETVIKPESRGLLGCLSALAYLSLVLTAIFGMRLAGLHSFG